MWQQKLIYIHIYISITGPFLHSCLAAQTPFISVLQESFTLSHTQVSSLLLPPCGRHFYYLWKKFKKKNHTTVVGVPNWSSAAVYPQWVQTAHWRTFRRWTGHILPWSPVCSIAGRYGKCFHSAWNRSATGLWPCYRLQGEIGLEKKLNGV